MEQFTLFAISLLANLFSAFSGGGAGLLQLPALIFLGLPFGVALATHKIASVALVMVGVFWNGSGAITLGLLGDVQWSWVPVLLAGSLLGGYLGAHLAITKGNRWIKRGFEAVTLMVGIKLILG